MKLYNSMTGRKEEFIPLDGKNVKMYACGITVYDLSHIGHARQAIAYAMVADYLRYRGYNVKYVRNYTDVDDKIIDRANKLGKDPLEFSREQIEETEKDMANLHITGVTVDTATTNENKNLGNAMRVLVVSGNEWQVWSATGELLSSASKTGTAFTAEVKKDTDATVDVYVYYDGDDTNIYSDNLKNLTSNGVTITFEATPKEYKAAPTA